MSGKRAVDYDFVFKNKDSFFNQMREKCEYYHSFKENEKILNNEHVEYHWSGYFTLPENLSICFLDSNKDYTKAIYSHFTRFAAKIELKSISEYWLNTYE